MATTADIPQILAAAGCKVVVEGTWNLTPRGPFPIENPKVVWHHDASAVGPSPGALGWITTEYAAGNPSAQLWVDTAGVWHCVGKGLASHAGLTDGSARNSDSIGIETDHTVNEDWPSALLSSLRLGTAALLLAFNRPPTTGLWFHKTIAVFEDGRHGRKVDPDGLELDHERLEVAALMRLLSGGIIETPGGGTTPTAPPTTEEDDLTMANIDALIAKLDENTAAINRGNALAEQQLAQDKLALENLRDVRTATLATREAFVKIGSGESVIKTRTVL